MVCCDENKIGSVCGDLVGEVLHHLGPKVADGIATAASWAWDRMTRDDSFRGKVGKLFEAAFDHASSGVGNGMGAAIGIVLVGGAVYLRNKYWGGNEVACRIGSKAMKVV